MRLPENGRLFVGGTTPGTSEADLRRHFCTYGEVADISLPRDRLTGDPRPFAFVQFSLPSDAGRALADSNHVINGRQVRVARANPKQPERSRNRFADEFKPLCQRIHWVDKYGYRVGDMMKMSFGPLSAKGLESEDVKQLRKFGVVINNMLIFECLIGYISNDGKECLVRWPPVKSDDDKAAAATFAQGNIISASSLKDLAQLSSGHIPNTGSTYPASSPEAGRSQSWCWLL